MDMDGTTQGKIFQSLNAKHLCGQPGSYDIFRRSLLFTSKAAEIRDWPLTSV